MPAGVGDDFPLKTKLPATFRRLEQTREGTFHATGGLARITGANPKTRARLAGLVLAALLCSVLVIWVSRTTWERVERLQGEFAGLKAESFYLGVRMKGDIQRLNDTLLRYRLRGDASDYDLFHTEGYALKEWLQAHRAGAVAALEREFFDHMGLAYDEYLAESLKLLEASRGRWQVTRAREFQESYEKLQRQSRHLLRLCDSFIADQRSAFDDFLKESQATLATFQLLLKVSLALLLALATALVVLVYRGMIAPLRHQLTESHAIIVRQEKLASLGVLAAGVAHEIRNPLTAIKFRLFSLKRSLPDGGVDNEDAAVINNEISRLEKIVKDFLQFARPSEPELIVMPAQRILQEVHDLLKAQLEKAGIELKLEASDPGWVRADRQQIKQVLINLVQNSADSIGRNGVIALRVRNHLALSPRGGKDGVALEVSDTGKGIPPDVQQRLFDPFFTTKEGGTGLGLSIAARIVEKHGGELRYQTQINRGTAFTIVLPQVAEHETQDPVD